MFYRLSLLSFFLLFSAYSVIVNITYSSSLNNSISVVKTMNDTFFCAVDQALPLPVVQ